MVSTTIAVLCCLVSSALSLVTSRSEPLPESPQLDRLRVPKESAGWLDGEGAEVWRGVDSFTDGVAVFVPGFGDDDRAPLVQANVAWLRRQTVPIECTIFVYKSAVEFPLDPALYEPCELVRHSGYWMEHISAFNRSNTSKKYIAHMMDGIAMNPGSDLKTMIDIMRQNELDMLSPTYRVSNQRWKMPGMEQDTSFKVGRQVNKAEFHFNLFTHASFACLQDFIDPRNNPLGWGVDVVYTGICHARIGLTDSMTFDKLLGGAYDAKEARAEATSFLGNFSDILPFVNKSFGVNTLGELVLEQQKATWPALAWR